MMYLAVTTITAASTAAKRAVLVAVKSHPSGLDGDRAFARLLCVLRNFFLDIAKLFASASRTTGTIRPRSVETATPMS